MPEKKHTKMIDIKKGLARTHKKKSLAEKHSLFYHAKDKPYIKHRQIIPDCPLCYSKNVKSITGYFKLTAMDCHFKNDC